MLYSQGVIKHIIAPPVMPDVIAVTGHCHQLDFSTTPILPACDADCDLGYQEALKQTKGGCRFSFKFVAVVQF